MTMDRPWIKLWRTILTDEKIAFILRRYGHDCMTFWVGVLTRCEGGVLLMEEEIFADLCLLETKRYEEIRGIFIKRGLLGEDEEGRLIVLNWGEYQVADSTERSRECRARKRAATAIPPPPSGAGLEGNGDATATEQDATPMQRTCNGDATTEGEGEGEAEGEGGSAQAREAPSPPQANLPGSTPPPSPTPDPDLAAARELVADWYEGLRQKTGVVVTPPPKAEAFALGLVRALGGDIAKARRLREEYFRTWRDHWFAVVRGDMQRPADQRRPDFDFRAYATSAPAHLLAQLAAREERTAAKDFSTAPPLDDEDLRPPTEEDRAQVAEAMSRAPAHLVRALGIGQRAS